jgi:hypothetical protein
MARFRDELIRAHFEAYRDLEWFETLEPRFREHGVDAGSMNVFRAAWNDYVQARDWDWWKDETKHMSNEELDDERMDCLDKLDALGMLQWERNRATKGEITFQDVLDAIPNAEDPKREQTQTRGKGRKR